MAVNTNATSVTIFMGFLEIFRLENEMSSKLVELAGRAQAVRNFNTIIYTRHSGTCEKYADNADNILKSLMQQSTAPVINLQGNTSYELSCRFDCGLLALAHLNGNSSHDRELLSTLWRILRRSLLTRLILLVNKDEHEENIKKLLFYCFKNKAFNVVLVKEAPNGDYVYYNFKVYPGFEMEMHQWKEMETKPVFMNKVKDMEGYSMSVITKSIGSMIHIREKINQTYILAGYVGHIFEEFSRKHNATLNFPAYETPNSAVSYLDIESFIENGTYDTSAETFVDSIPSDLVYSNIYDYIDWCIMVPVETSIPAYRFYVMVFDSTTISMILSAYVLFCLILAATYLIKNETVVYRELLFNIHVLNGLLGQSFKAERSFTGIRSSMFLLISVAGLVINISYATYLQTYNTSAPKEHVIKEIKDIRKSGKQIAFHADEVVYLKTFENKIELLPLIKSFDNYGEYHKMVSSFNVSYLYPVTSTEWFLYDQQQKIMSEHRFRLTDICIFNMWPMQFPLQPNSPYKEAFDDFISRLNQAGLIEYWKSMELLELLQLKQIKLGNMTNVAKFQPMKLEDMKLLMVLFSFAVILLCICFALEVLATNRRKLLNTCDCVV